ncbi:YfbR-like 5'-deoxynucleotidase [Phocicoccus pinnipedialis]|uniref:5'-deoxynucleotidase YfbR n=1 Tax=Phocicoccus pinnipedialis TaxID=110845 RepID=A0A6V7R3Q0_9BACL|nr:YfbR-like 5'-deoxynucleotidase [Jeotgalicoccus pinnipedialis]MBP1938788.1 putative hydrolase of HD superfamily [Jeotgalicoccus pinnipedialis]CAD2071552.1 5'-deoxynucleotidase YfbR [Jeotgalicoccus pinnipedialis]
MGIHQYFKSLNDLEKLTRMPGKFKYQEHNVAAHSFKVTKIAQYLATVEEYNGTEINWKLLYEKALNHDYPEIFTGDIKTPVKYASLEINQLFSQVEQTMTAKFVEREFPKAFQQIYKDRFSDGKDSTIEGQILSVADKIDLLYESFGEIQKGNPEELFFEVYEESLGVIKRYKHLACVRDFLKNILTEMLAERSIPQSELKTITEAILELE